MSLEEADNKYISILRDMDGNRRAKIGAELYETVRQIIESSIRNEHPDISEQELKEKLKARMNK